MSTKTRQIFASAEDVRRTTDFALQHVGETTILFVTSLREGEPRDMGDDGLSQLAQYYTEAQIDDILSVLSQTFYFDF